MRGGSGERTAAVVGGSTDRSTPTSAGGGGRAGMQGWPMVTAVVLAIFSLVPVFLTSALAPQIGADIPLTEGHLGIAVSAFFAASAVGNLALGPVSDRFGGVRMMRLFSLPAGAALGFIGVGARSWVAFAVALAVAGIGNGGVQTAANEILVHSVSAARQGLAFGVKQASIPAATLLSGVAVPAVGVTVGWRWGFVGAAVSAVALGQYLPWATGQRHPRPARAPRATTAGAARPDQRADRSRLFLLAVGAALSCAAANSLGAFFVLAATNTGLSDTTAGLLTAVGGLSSLSMRLVAGHLGGRRNGWLVYGAAGLAATGTFGYLLLALMRPWSMAPAVVIAYGAGWGWMGLLAFAAARRFPLAPGWATGVVQSGAAVGGCLGPLVFGFAVVRFGYPLAWTAVAGVNCLGAAVLAVAGRTSGSRDTAGSQR